MPNRSKAQKHNIYPPPCQLEGSQTDDCESLRFLMVCSHSRDATSRRYLDNEREEEYERKLAVRWLTNLISFLHAKNTDDALLN